MFLNAILQTMGHEQVEYAREALAAMHPDLSQDRWLLARRALLDVFDAVDLHVWVKAYDALEKDAREKRFDEDSRDLLGRADEAVDAALRGHAGYDDARMTAFRTARARTRKCYDITRQTDGHSFEVRVHMPGEVVAHNAGKIDAGDGAAVWRFNGRSFRDRTWEIRITSRIPTEEADD